MTAAAPAVIPSSIRIASIEATTLVNQRRAQPLTTWKAWHREPPLTSQLTAVQQLALEITALFGGNRSGKTEAARTLAGAFALGGDHPAVRMFCEHNGIPPGTIPDGPGKVYMVALSSNDSLRYHREQIAKLLPRAGVRWWNRNYRGEARCRIEVPGYDEYAEIWFKSCDQGREAMQGDAVRLIVFDEEPPEDVFNEARMRLLDQAGRIILSMTPLKGLTWVYDKIASVPNTRNQKSFWIHTRHNPWLPPERLEDVFNGLSNAEAAARAEGRFIALEGLVWPQWSRALHVCEAFEVPEDWPRYRVIDFGTRNPTAVLWGALSPDDVLYLYREHYEAEKTLAHHAEVMKRYTEPISQTWADPKHPQLMLDLVDTHGIDCEKANKDVRLGIDVVARRLHGVDVEGKRVVGLQVFDTLVNFIREIENYIWDPATQGRADQREQPLKKHDHLMDDLRYMCVGIQDSVVYCA